MKLRNHILNALSLLSEKGKAADDLCCDVGTVIRKMILFKGTVPRGLDRKRTIFTAHGELKSLVDDVLITPAIPEMPESERPLKEARQAVRGDRIRYDNRMRVRLCLDGREQCDQLIPVHFGSVRKDHGSTVAVTVKNHTQVRARCLYGALCRVHGTLVLGIRHMIRKVTVRRKKHAAAHIRAERLEYLGRKETGRAVAGIHCNFKAVQNFASLLFARLFADNVAHMGRINAAKWKVGRRCVNLICAPQNAVEFLTGKRTAHREKLHAVPLVGQMARRQHNGAVERSLVQYGRLEHGRGRNESATASLHASETLEAGFFHHLRRDAAVVSDGNPECLPVHLRIIREIVGKGRSDALNHLRGQRNLLVRGLNHRAAHIVSVLDTQKVFQLKLFSLHTTSFPF